MVKKVALLICLFLAIMAVRANAYETPRTFRTWEYLEITGNITPNWAVYIMPGHVYEWERDDGRTGSIPSNPGATGRPRRTVLQELFVGPKYTVRFDALMLQVQLLYYFMGFPNNGPKITTGATSQSNYSDNIELIPIVSYRFGNFVFWNRIIFHNTYSTTAWDNMRQQYGYSLLLREYFRLGYIWGDYTFTIGDEVFIGLIEDISTNGAQRNQEGVDGDPGVGRRYTNGFSLRGFNQNRLYTGITYKFTDYFAFTVNYIYQTQYQNWHNNNVTEYDHYLQLIARFTFNVLPSAQ